MRDDELDLETGLLGDGFGILPNLFAIGLRPLRVVEEANPSGGQIARHGRGVADLGKSPGEDDAIEAGEDAADPIRVAFEECYHDATSDDEARCGAQGRCYSDETSRRSEFRSWPRTKSPFVEK